MDKDLLRALGYSDMIIQKMEVWENELKQYFQNDLGYKDQLESYYQADYKEGLIVFRNTCPKQVQSDLQRIFDNIFTTKN